MAPVGLFPPVIGEMELWQIGSLLGSDEEQPGGTAQLILPHDPTAPVGVARVIEVN